MTNPTFPTDTQNHPAEEHPNPLGIPKDLPVHMVIKELCGDLARAMQYAPTDTAVLDDQVQILNALFNATLAEQLNLAQQQYGESRAQGWLELALKIQKQCMDTVRTRQSASYLDRLSDLHSMKIHRALPAAKTQKAPNTPYHGADCDD